MLSDSTVPHAAHEYQRVSMLISDIAAKRKRICCYCSVVMERRFRWALDGPICLLSEPEHTSHGVCLHCSRLVYAAMKRGQGTSPAISRWIARRRAHVARMRLESHSPWNIA